MRASYRWTRGATQIPVELINDEPKTSLGRPKGNLVWEKKRKTTQALQLMDGLQGQQKRPTQGQQPKIMSAQPAHIELTPEGFFQVQVEKDHSSKIAKGCGLSTEVVMQILQEDNEARKIESAAPSYENLDKE